MMDTPRRRRMALQGIEHQLPQVGPEGRAVAQHEGRADGHAFAAFAGQAQGNLQQCGDMPRHGPCPPVMLQPGKVPRWRGDEEGVQAVRAGDAGQPQHLRVRAEVPVEGREKHREVELVEAVEEDLRDGQHHIVGRIRQGQRLPVARDPDDALAVAQLRHQAQVADFVRLHHEVRDAQGARQAERALHQCTRVAMVCRGLTACVPLHGFVNLLRRISSQDNQGHSPGPPCL